MSHLQPWDGLLSILLISSEFFEGLTRQKGHGPVCSVCVWCMCAFLNYNVYFYKVICIVESPCLEIFKSQLDVRDPVQVPLSDPA